MSDLTKKDELVRAFEWAENEIKRSRNTIKDLRIENNAYNRILNA